MALYIAILRKLYLFRPTLHCLFTSYSFQPCQNSANTVWFNCELPIQHDLYFLWSTLDSVIHLGNYLMTNLSVDLDIQMKTMDLINQGNTVLSRFNLADSVLKTHLLQSYSLSFYGEALLCLSSSQVKALEVCYNSVFGHFLVHHILLLFIWLLSSYMATHKQTDIHTRLATQSR